MEALTNIQQNVATQNAQVGKTPTPVETPPEGTAKPEVQAKPKLGPKDSKQVVKVKGKEVEKPAAVAPDAKKEERNERLTALRALAKQTQTTFVEGQKAREVRIAADAEVSKLKAEADLAKNELALATKDPLAWLESKGVKARALAERIAKQGGTAGETAEDLKKLQQQILDLEAKNETARKEWQDREKQAQSRAAFEAAKKSVLAVFDSGKDKLPTLHAVMDGPEEIIQEFIALEKSIYESKDPDVQAYLQSGGTYSSEEVFDALEAKWAKKLSKMTPAEAAKVEGTVAKPVIAEKAVKKPTLTPGGASTAGALPADFKKLPPKEQVKALAAQYRALKGV